MTRPIYGTDGTIPPDKWGKLRNWMNNLIRSEKITNTDKKGIRIALKLMDRIEEAE